MRLIILSGAGLSAESGLATFRNSPDGLWENHPIEIVCDYLTWKRNYDLVHRFYNARRAQLAEVQPNAAHRQIANWQTRYPTTIITQNVDDLLERAGCTEVVHLHGDLTQMQCTACGHIWDVGYNAWTEDDRCPIIKCSSHKGVKPAVVLFNEEAPRYQILRAAIQQLTGDDFIVVTGTSEVVIPFGGYLRNRPGYKIFNALDPSLSGAYDQHMIMPATEAMPIIDHMLRERWDSQ